MTMTAEEERLAQEQNRTAYWSRWGPYLSERQWGTVREDYSADGNAWSYFPHDHARSRAYRWGEDGIAGISDNHQRENRYFDVYIEYAKNSPEDILIWIHVANRGSEAKTLYLLPTLWFRNYWSWSYDFEKPILKCLPDSNVIEAVHPLLKQRWLYFQEPTAVLFIENETNSERLFNVPNQSFYVKDGINNYLIHGQQDAVNPKQVGTKAAIHYALTVQPGETRSVKLRLSDISPDSNGHFLLPTLKPFFTPVSRKQMNFMPALQSPAI